MPMDITNSASAIDQQGLDEEELLRQAFLAGGVREGGSSSSGVAGKFAPRTGENVAADLTTAAMRQPAAPDSPNAASRPATVTIGASATKAAEAPDLATAAMRSTPAKAPTEGNLGLPPIANRMPPTPPSGLGDLTQKQAQFGTPLDPRDPKYKLGWKERLGRIGLDAIAGLGGGKTLPWGPGATNRQFDIDEALRQANLANVNTQIGTREKTNEENRKLYESGIKSSYESQVGEAKQKTAEAQQQKADIAQQLADAKTKGPGLNIPQLNQMLTSRYQVLNPNQPLPAQYKLSDDAKKEDYDRIDKALEAEERARGTQAQRETANAMRQQAAALAAGNRGDARTDKSYQFHTGLIQKDSAPIEARAERVSRLEDTLNQGTPQADALVAPELLSIMAGGQGSGLRMNEAEIARIIGGRTQWQTLKAKLQAWRLDPSKSFSLTTEQRKQTRALFTAVKERVARKLQTIDAARGALVDTDDPKEHKRIYNKLKKDLDAIDTGGSATRGAQTPKTNKYSHLGVVYDNQ